MQNWNDTKFELCKIGMMHNWNYPKLEFCNSFSTGEERPGFDHTTFDKIGHYAYTSTQHHQGFLHVGSFQACKDIAENISLSMQSWSRPKWILAMRMTLAKLGYLSLFDKLHDKNGKKVIRNV